MPGTINVTTDNGTGVSLITLQIPGVAGTSGPKGDRGDPGQANVLTIGTVSTLAAAANATATITGVSPNQVLNIGIPQGLKGDKGDPNTLTIGTVTTVNATTGASATITGTAPNQVLNLVVPRGYGVIPAGAAGSLLVKASGNDYDTAWTVPSSAEAPNTIVLRDANGWAQFANLAVQNAPASADQVTRKDYVDNRDAATLSSANSHADTGDTNTLASAKSYTDSTDANRKTYVDTQDTATLNSAKTYADTQDATNLASAKSYADTHDATTLASAKSYSDSQDVTNLASAKSYTDTQFTTPPASRKLVAALGSGATFPASGMLAGDTFLRTDIGTNGSIWTYVGGTSGVSGWVHKGFVTCTSTTRPTVTYAGMQIFETDTGLNWQWSGTAWASLLMSGDGTTFELAYATGWTGYKAAPWTGIRYWKRGGTVTVAGPGTTTASVAASALVGTLPVGFRPPVGLQVKDMNGNGALNFASDGTITFGVAESTGYVLVVPPVSFGAA